MKLQLNKNTFNAYINEAIKQEINEAGFLSGIGKVAGEAGKGIAKGAKSATKGVKNYVKALGGNKKAVKKASSKISDIDAELKKIHSAQDANIKAQAGVPDWDKNLRDKLGREGWDLVDQERALTKGRDKLTTKLNQAKAGSKLARTSTAAAAGGFGAGYLLGRNGKGGQKDPNAPWNDSVDDNSGNGGDNGSGDNGWDGAFPWDDVQPRWTPRPKPRTAQPKPAQTQPEEPQKPRAIDTPLERVDTSKMNLPGQVSQLNAPGLSGDRPVQQPTVAQSAIHTMVQTTNANDNRPLQNRADLNRRTAGDAKDVINQNVQNGNMSRKDARAQKQQINQARRNLNRTGQPISN